MIKALYITAWTGLILSAAVHILLLNGLGDVFSDIDAFVWILHVGAIILGFPAILCSQKITMGTKENDFRKTAKQNCPSWMKKMVVFFIIYGIINYIIFIISGVESNGPGTPASVFRGFSGHWMIFYSIEVSAFYSFLHSEKYITFQHSDQKKRLVSRLLKGGVFAVLFIFLSITCFVTGHTLLFIFVFISVWFMGLLTFLVIASACVVHVIYFIKYHPGLLRKSYFGPYNQRVEYAKQLQQMDEPGLQKIKNIYKKIAWILFYLWLFGIVPAICVLYFVYAPKEILNP